MSVTACLSARFAGCASTFTMLLESHLSDMETPWEDH